MVTLAAEKSHESAVTSGAGVDCREDRTIIESRTVPVRTAMGYGSDSVAAERSDGYKLGSAFFKMTPFRYNVFEGFKRWLSMGAPIQNVVDH